MDRNKSFTLRNKIIVILYKRNLDRWRMLKNIPNWYFYMKAISILMLLILFFLLFNPERQNTCCMQVCPYMSGKMAWKADSKKEKKGNCQNCHGCCAMTPVPAPVYVPIEPIKLNPYFTVHFRTTLPIYQLRKLSSYSTSDWKPPKC